MRHNLGGITLLWLAGLNIGNFHMMHYVITWSVWISNFEKPLTVPLNSLNGRQITSSWRQSDAAMSFWRHNNVVIALCVRWGATQYTCCYFQNLLSVFHRDVVILTKFSSLASPQVVIFTTFVVASGEYFMKVWLHFRFNAGVACMVFIHS